MLKKKIEKLIDLIENTEIEEIEVSSFWGAQKIKLSKSKTRQNVVVSNIPQADEERSADIATKKTEELKPSLDVPVESTKLEKLDSDGDNYEDETKFKIILAPLVGTFYSSPKPEDPTFINIGENVQIGQIVCIIEAMKIFNEIENDSGISGELVHTYVKDGTPVEYGQELFVLRINNV